MDGYSAITATGRVFAGEWDTIFAPRSPRVGTCGVVLCHGSGNPQEFIDPVNQPASVALAAALASAGIPCISGDFGNQTWGNATVQSRITAAWNVLKGLYPQMRTDKVALLGISMGGAAVTIYAQQNPTKVAAIVGIIPLVDLVSFYTQNIGGAQSQIATAWSVTAPAALPAAANNAANASLTAAIPTLLGYSTADNTINPSWVTAYAAAAGPNTNAQIISTTLDHSDAAIAAMPISRVGAFLASNGC